MLSLSQRPLSTPTTKASAQTTWPNICRLCFLWKRSCKNPRAVTSGECRGLQMTVTHHGCRAACAAWRVDGLWRLHFHPLLCSFRVYPACLVCLPFTAGLLFLGNEVCRFFALVCHLVLTSFHSFTLLGQGLQYEIVSPFWTNAYVQKIIIVQIHPYTENGPFCLLGFCYWESKWNMCFPTNSCSLPFQFPKKAEAETI